MADSPLTTGAGSSNDLAPTTNVATTTISIYLTRIQHSLSAYHTTIGLWLPGKGLGAGER